MEQKIWKAVWPTKANSHMPRREDPVSPSEDWVVGGGGEGEQEAEVGLSSLIEFLCIL